MITWKDDIGVVHILDPLWTVPNSFCNRPTIIQRNDESWNMSRRRYHRDMEKATITERNAGAPTCFFCLCGPPHGRRR